MTNCWIGTVKMKSGGAVIKRIKNTNLAEIEGGHEFIGLNEAAKHVRDGRAMAVSVSVILDNGDVYRNFNFKEGIHSTQILGSIEMLRQYAMEWALS